MGCSCCSESEVDRASERADCNSGDCRPCAGSSADSSNDEAGARARLESRILAIRFIASGLLFAVGAALNFAHTGYPVVFFLLSWIIAGYRVLWNALRNIARGDFFDENFLMSAATIGAFILGQWSEGAAVMLFYNLGEMVQESAVYRSRKSITDLLDVRPDEARLASDGSVVHPSAVAPGSLIRVLPGEKVPLDGIVTEGSSSFETSALTGESVPRAAEEGSEALAGFVNGSGMIVVRTTASFADTAASKMLDLIENARGRKAKAERLITRFARIYTPIVTIGAVLLAILPPLAAAAFAAEPLAGWASFAPWVERALVFLVISCPCAFVISVPLGFFGGIGGAAKKGILVKGADCIDALAKTRAVVFDKTGTLTEGAFRVSGVETAPGWTESEVASLAFAAEEHSTHPLASAIRSWASSAGIEKAAGIVANYSESGGKGVSMDIDGRRVMAGSASYLSNEGVAALPSASSATAVDVSSDGAWAGRILLGDSPKSDAARAVRELRSLGVSDIVMLTGDSESAARPVAERLGITDFRAGVLPHQKVEEFDRVAKRYAPLKKGGRSRGSVLFVGDGINDAPVLARADAGIAMGGIGSDAAIESADVVLMNDNPLLVAEAVRTARWTQRIVAQNIALSFAIKLGFLALGAFGIATLWEAVFADVGVALLATVNSLRARK